MILNQQLNQDMLYNGQVLNNLSLHRYLQKNLDDQFDEHACFLKLSTKNPDLNLFNPFASVIVKFAVSVSRRDKSSIIFNTFKSFLKSSNVSHCETFMFRTNHFNLIIHYLQMEARYFSNFNRISQLSVVLLDHQMGHLEYKQNHQFYLRIIYLFLVDNNHKKQLSFIRELKDLEHYSLRWKRS